MHAYILIIVMLCMYVCMYIQVKSRKWLKPQREGGGGGASKRQPAERYPLSVLDKMLCPITIINMHYIYEQTLNADM